MLKHCSVVCDTPQGLVHCELALPGSATVADALEAARQRLGVPFPEAPVVGIYGELCTPDDVPAEGDRIEVYRALAADPRAARRARLARARERVRRGPGT